MAKTKHRLTPVLLTLCIVAALFSGLGLAMPVRAKAAGTYVVTVNTTTANWAAALSAAGAYGGETTLKLEGDATIIDAIWYEIRAWLATGTGAGAAVTTLDLSAMSSLTQLGSNSGGGNPAACGLTTVVWPTSSQLDTIGIFTFARCNLAGTVTLPDSVTELNVGSFGGNTGLTAFSAPGVTTVSMTVFNGCTSLASVALPALTFIEDMAFVDLPNFTLELGLAPVSVILANDPFYGILGTLTLKVPAALQADWEAYVAANSGSGQLFDGITVTVVVASAQPTPTPTPTPTPAPDAGTEGYYQRHYDYWLSVFVQLNALPNNGKLTIDTAGQNLDHIQHFVFDALVGTSRTLTIKHQGLTYIIRGASRSADSLWMGNILLGHNHSFELLARYKVK